MTKCCRFRQYAEWIWAAVRTRRSMAVEMEARVMRSRERGSQTAGHCNLSCLGFAHQSSPIHLHQGI